MEKITQLKIGYLSSLSKLNLSIDSYLQDDKQPKKILFLDDEKLTLKYFKKYFEYKIPGAEIFFSDSAVNAKRVMFDHNIDLLITDLKMPVFNGKEIIKTAKNLNPSIKVIVVTAYRDEAECVSEECFLKPIDNLGLLYQSVLRNLSLSPVSTI